jgi:hypothetical protein
VHRLPSSQSGAAPPTQVFVPSTTRIESMSWPIPPAPLSLPMRHRNWTVFLLRLPGAGPLLVT